MVRVLQELASLDGGGVAKVLYEYYKNMDRNKIHFDFIIYNFYDEGIYEKPLREMGCTIYKLPTPKAKRSISEINKIIKNGNYDIVHTHIGGRGYRILKIANKYGVKCRCMHSHIAHEVMGIQSRCARALRLLAAGCYVTDKFACGREAGIDMWGRRAYWNHEVHIMKNAVDTTRFVFDPKMREQKRKELGAGNQLVLGIVARLSSQKNYPFLFHVYSQILERREDVILVVVGRGLEEEQIRGLAKKKNLYDKIQFLGVRDDVPELLNAFDLFLLPSLYEGLPVTLMETQANGLRAMVSDQITKEMAVTDLIEFMGIAEENLDEWVEKICSFDPLITGRENYAEKVALAGYDIIDASREMEIFYVERKKA